MEQEKLPLSVEDTSPEWDSPVFYDNVTYLHSIPNLTDVVIEMEQDFTVTIPPVEENPHQVTGYRRPCLRDLVPYTSGMNGAEKGEFWDGLLLEKCKLAMVLLGAIVIVVLMWVLFNGPIFYEITKK